jgi:hypothetical protein
LEKPFGLAEKTAVLDAAFYIASSGKKYRESVFALKPVYVKSKCLFLLLA